MNKGHYLQEMINNESLLILSLRSSIILGLMVRNLLGDIDFCYIY